MSKRKAKKKPTGLSPTDALAMCDDMGMGEYAALQAAADMCGMAYEDFIEALATEAGVP